jgi:hypothetical protein
MISARRACVVAIPDIRNDLPPPAAPPKPMMSASLSKAMVCGPGLGLKIGS